MLGIKFLTILSLLFFKCFCFRLETPGEGDLRGPCPFLNALANHNYLPHNGKDITISQVLDTSKKGFNVEPDVLGLFAKLALITSANYTVFSLTDINLHDCIETDASLSRADAFTNANNLGFNETIYQTLASSNPGVDYYNVTSAGAVMKARLADSVATNPELVNGDKEITFRATESALYLIVLGNPDSGVAPKKFVDVLFSEERIPYDEGWAAPSVPINGSVVGPIAGSVMNASQWVATGGNHTGALPFTVG
ncbi:Cloroperoxidase [Gymnopus androsaceus JB14]|uniref:Cloroperoxidase n=1 Tax=Gymnopus androsaceus JB14 TaxID=1447944 RepID=A0A6A4HX40_9AGAR|nr:Cloroperoxidase [Gymnopus androsaceus JB14]